MSALAAWTTALDEFEARVDAQREAMGRGDVVDLPDFEAPPGLGPIPPDLRHRALGLLADASAVERALADAAAALSRQTQAVRRHRVADQPQRPSFFDRAL